MSKFVYVVFFAGILFACSSLKVKQNSKPIHSAPIPVKHDNQALRKGMIIKTNEDITNLVPVRLSKDKKSILSYPAPSDLPFQTTYQLENGYLLDLVGVNENSAYLDLTIQTYKKLNQVYSLEEMKNHLKIISPFVELYECSYESDQSSTIIQLNQWIRQGLLSEKCKKIPLSND